MGRVFALEEQNMSSDPYWGLIEGKRMRRQIAPTPEGEVGFTVSFVPSYPGAGVVPSWALQTGAAVAASKSSLSASAALSSSAVFVFMGTGSHIKAQLAVPSFASVTCRKTKLKYLFIYIYIYSRCNIEIYNYYIFYNIINYKYILYIIIIYVYTYKKVKAWYTWDGNCTQWCLIIWPSRGIERSSGWHGSWEGLLVARP